MVVPEDLPLSTTIEFPTPFAEPVITVVLPIVGAAPS